MKFTKTSKTYEEQADLLLSRGLIAEKNQLIQTLEVVNYYRLSGYFYPYRSNNGQDDAFQPGTTLEKVWRRYTFDRRLRFLLLDAIERVEVALRTKLVYIFVHKYGPFGYLDADNFPNLDDVGVNDFHSKLKSEIARSKEGFITHFNTQYGDNHDMPPLWMACELFSFGLFLTFYRGVEKKIKQDIAKQMGVPDVVLFSWLICLNTVRNLCAHHGRTFDKQLRYYLPNHQRKHPDWFIPVKINAGRIFGVLTLLRFCLWEFAPNSQWHQRLYELFKEYQDIPLKELGFPCDWKKSSFWSEGELDEIRG